MGMVNSRSGEPSGLGRNVSARAAGIPRLAPWQVKFAQSELGCADGGRLRLTDVAAKLKLSVGYFSRAFKNTVGDTPYQWYQRQRITKSIQLLDDNSRTLAEIAIECGFTDESHFITTFSRSIGLTPGRWRRRKLQKAATTSR